MVLNIIVYYHFRTFPWAYLLARERQDSVLSYKRMLNPMESYLQFKKCITASHAEIMQIFMDNLQPILSFCFVIYVLRISGMNYLWQPAKIDKLRRSLRTVEE